MKNKLRLILFLIGLSLLFALIYRVGFSEIIKIISGANIYIALSGIFVYLILIFIRSLKWFLLTRIIKDTISYRQFFPLYLVNSLMGNLTPFKSGETITPVLFKKYLKIPVGQGFSIVILDRFFELVIFTIILVLSIFYMLSQGIQNLVVLSIFQGVLIAIFLLLVVMVTIIISRRATFKIVRFFKILRFIEKELDGFYNALSLFKNKRVYRRVIPLTILGWFLEVFACYLIFSSIFSLPFINVIVAEVIAAAATFVTFIPGGVGVGDVGMVYILSLLNHPVALATSGAILARLFLSTTLIITGLIGSVLIKQEERNA